jgi:hypothetical protein
MTDEGQPGTAKSSSEQTIEDFLRKMLGANSSVDDDDNSLDKRSGEIMILLRRAKSLNKHYCTYFVGYSRVMDLVRSWAYEKHGAADSMQDLDKNFPAEAVIQLHQWEKELQLAKNIFNPIELVNQALRVSHEYKASKAQFKSNSYAFKTYKRFVATKIVAII